MMIFYLSVMAMKRLVMAIEPRKRQSRSPQSEFARPLQRRTEQGCPQMHRRPMGSHHQRRTHWLILMQNCHY